MFFQNCFLEIFAQSIEIHLRHVFEIYSELFNPFLTNVRNNRREVFCRKVALKNFTKFTKKHLCWSLFSNKATAMFNRNTWNTRTRCEICSKLTIKTLDDVLTSISSEIMRKPRFSDDFRGNRRLDVVLMFFSRCVRHLNLYYKNSLPLLANRFMLI